MKYKCEKYLTALVDLSSTHSKDELILRFVNALKHELEDSEIVLYEVFLQRASDLKTNIPIARDFFKPKGEKVPVSSDKTLKECYEKREKIKNEDNNRRVYPIIDRNHVDYLLSITGHSFTLANTIITEKIIALFNNQMVLINARDHDHLTGLLNRQAFNRLIPAIYKGGNKPNYSYVGMLDIDHFKYINDGFGHVIGDEILLLISQHLQSNFRPDDIVVRYGGEEFLVLLKEADIEDAYTIFERCRSYIEKYTFPQVGKVTISIGYCRFDLRENLLTQIQKADKALYFSKENGRNLVSSYEILTIDKKMDQVTEHTGNIILLN